MSILVDEEEPLVDVEDPPFEPRDVKVRQEDVEAEFDIYDFLGRGKFGEVKRCVEKVSGKEFAAKFIVAPGPQDKSEVEQEVEIMKKLQHKRLLQLYDCFCSKTEMCLVLEIILGGELFDRVIDDDFILTERACVVFMRQICEGVDYMHSRNIIHLDMKPENILCLSRTGNRIKIIDFGLAREYNPKKDLRVLFGTPEFMAPEVVQYEPIAFATDMWSVGVICYVLLSGLSPFMGDNDGETLVNVIKGGYDFCYAEFSDVTEPAKDIIRKLLVKDKTKRLTAKECLEHPWLKREEPKRRASQLDRSKRRLKRFVYRRKWQKIVNAIIALKRMGVRLKTLRNRRSMSGAFKKQESIFGWDAKKGAPSNVKNGMKTPEVLNVTADVTSEVCKLDVKAVDNVTGDTDTVGAVSAVDDTDTAGAVSAVDDTDTAGAMSAADDTDTDSNAGVSVSATFVLNTDFTGNTTQEAEATCSLVTVEAEQSISLDDTVSHVSVEADLDTTGNLDSDTLAQSEQAGIIESSSSKPKKPEATCDDETSKDSQKVKRKGKEKQKAKEKEEGTEKTEVKEKVADKGKTKDKEKEKAKAKDKDKDADKGKAPWCRPGRPEPGTLRHVPISERIKPAPKRQEAPWSKRRIKKQDGIHLHTLKDWREVKTGNSKVSRDIPAESTMSTIETSATDSPDRDQPVTDSLLTVDTGSGSRSRKNSDNSRKISDSTPPEAPATMHVCRKSNRIEIENGRPKSQNLDNVDVMADFGNGIGTNAKGAEKGKENGGLVEMKAYGRSKSDQPVGSSKNKTKRAIERREFQPSIQVHEPVAMDKSATQLNPGSTDKTFLKYKHKREADTTKEEPPDSQKTMSQNQTKASEKPGAKVDIKKDLVKSNVNPDKPLSAAACHPEGEKQKAVGIKSAMKLDTKTEPRSDQDSTKQRVPEVKKTVAPNFKRSERSDAKPEKSSFEAVAPSDEHKQKTVGMKSPLKLDMKTEPQFDQDNTKPKTQEAKKTAASNFRKSDKANTTPEKPGSNALSNGEKQKPDGVKSALKLNMKAEPRFDQDNTKPKTPEAKKTSAPNFKKASKHKRGDKYSNQKSNPVGSEPTDPKAKQLTERDPRSRSPVRQEPIFGWQKHGFRKTSLPPEDTVPHSKPSSEVKTPAMPQRGKFTSEENLSSSSHTKSLIQNSPWTRSQSMQDGDGYSNLQYHKPFKGPPVIFPGIKEVPQQDNGDPRVVAGHNLKGGPKSKLPASTPCGTMADKAAEGPPSIGASNKSTLDNTGLGTTCQSLVHSGFATLPRKRPGAKSKAVVAKTLSDTLESPSSEEPKDVNGAGSVVEGDGESEDQTEVKIMSIQDRIRLLKTQNEEKDAQPKVQFHYGPDDE